MIVVTDKISVVIPVYNTAKYLPECLESALNQTYENFELILVDDGSVDQSGKICDTFAKKDQRITVIHKDNAGVSAARNDGIREATGKYICFIDSDDWVEPDYLETLARNMEPGGMSVCSLTTNRKLKTTDEIEIMDAEHAQISVLSVRGFQGFAVARLFDLDLIRANQIVVNGAVAICEDVLFSVHYIRYMEKNAVWNKKQIYHYRVRMDGATRKRSTEKISIGSKELSEPTAIELCERYVLNSPQVKEACSIRHVQAAVSAIRVLTAHKKQKTVLFKELINEVRSGIFRYCKSPYTIWVSRISVLLCAVSPWIEWKVWKIHHTMRMKNLMKQSENND